MASVLGVLPTRAAHGADFWRGVVDPDREVVDGLVGRARAHLDRAAPGGVSRQNAAVAQALLAEALARKPRHYTARFLRGDALALQGQPALAIAELKSACALAPTAEDEASCTLRLAVEQSRGGRLHDSLSTYERHLQLGGPEGLVHANTAEVLMALGRLPEAVEGYRRAIELETRRPPGHGRDAALALALYGLAVALDRDEQGDAAAEPLRRAIALDPRAALLPGPGEPGGEDLFFIPSGDVHYYRGLALRAQGRPQDAVEAFQRFCASVPDSRFVARAEAHLRQLGRPPAPSSPPSDPRARAVPDAGMPRPAPGRPERVRRWRLVAAATTETDGPIPAPLLDAAWKGQRRLFEPCFEEAPPLGTNTTRLTIDLRLDGRGVLTRVTAKAPPEWPETAACLEDRLRRGVRFPRPTRPEPTRAQLELVVSMNGRQP